jgi:hypothetical protein
MRESTQPCRSGRQLFLVIFRPARTPCINRAVRMLATTRPLSVPYQTFHGIVRRMHIRPTCPRYTSSLRQAQGQHHGMMSPLCPSALNRTALDMQTQTMHFKLANGQDRYLNYHCVSIRIQRDLKGPPFAQSASESKKQVLARTEVDFTFYLHTISSSLPRLPVPGSCLLGD